MIKDSSNSDEIGLASKSLAISTIAMDFDCNFHTCFLLDLIKDIIIIIICIKDAYPFAKAYSDW